MFEIGSSLRTAREQRQLQLPEIERATRIRTKYLQALEEERWEISPALPTPRASCGPMRISSASRARAFVLKPPTTTARVHATTTARTLPQPPRLAHLTLAATRGPCWLEVRSSGKTLLLQGQRALFTGKRLWLRVGAPWNLDAKLNGNPFTLPGSTGNIVVSP